MKRFTMFACLALALVLAQSSFASDSRPHVFKSLANENLTGTEQGVAKAARDTTWILGPSATFKGTFQDGSGNANWNGWTHYDITQPTVERWQASTYYAVTGVYSAWCGSMQYPTCGSDPVGGYGNNYNEMLEWRGTVADNSLSCQITAQYNLQYDVEPGYDYAILSCEKADQGIIDVAFWTGKGLVAVNEAFSYVPGDYMGVNSNEVVVLFRVTSDGGWSDEDCRWPGNGACQIDDVVIGLSNGLGYSTTFEDGTLGAFNIRFPLGVGDYAKLWNGLEDVDPCNTNYSWQVAFIDDGLVVPGTGGTPCVDWCYGPSGFIINTTGGLAGGDAHLNNAIESPVMNWAVASDRGAILSFNVYRHEYLTADAAGIFYTWGVRTATDAEDISLQPWADRNTVYYGGPDYIDPDYAIGDLMTPGRTKVQIQLTAYELGWFWGAVGNNGTPAPYFDNVRFKTYPVVGPGMSIDGDWDHANDGFPENGQVDYANLGNNSVRFDQANNIALTTELRNDPGDSVTVFAVVTRPGAALVENPRMVYKLKPNPLFNPYRTSGVPNEGFVVMDSVKTSVGNVLKDKYFADLPDTGFFFPGDIIHYYFEATDAVGGGSLETATLPGDTTGFSVFDEYNPLSYSSSYTVRALPTVKSAAIGDHPPVLFWNDFGNRGGQDEWQSALANLGLLAGRDYDVYYTQAPSSGVGNGLGGRATQFHLENYQDMLYTAGDLEVYTINDLDYTADASNDAAVLDLWMKQGGKDIFLTGNDFVGGMISQEGLALGFVETYIGVSLSSNDVRPLIGNQTSPRVLVEGGNPVFTSVSSWIAFGGCPGIDTFDAVEPSGSTTRLAQFANTSGNPGAYPYSAATLNEVVADDASVIYMPVDLMFVFTDPDEGAKADAELSARARVLKDVLAYFGIDPNPGDVTAVPDAEKFAAKAYPNPFNPKTTIAYTVAKPGHMTLKVYNLRGELVKTLIDGLVETSSSIEWDGDNNAGAKVSSGVYFYEARMGNDVVVNKMALVK